MAGGPIHPYSAMPDASGEVGPFSYKTAAGRFLEGMGIVAAAALTGNHPWWLFFDIPVVLPTGTPKILVGSRTSVTSGNISFELLWLAAARSGHNPDGTLVSEGVSTFAANGTADRSVETKVEMNVTTVPAAGQKCIVEFRAIDTTHTITAVSIHDVGIIWE